MIPTDAMHAADELAGRLREGALPRLGFVDVGKGSRLQFEPAVRLTLGDLARFTRWERTGRAVPAERWDQLGADLTRLHRLSRGPQSPRVRS
jgi:hypothetical protein